METPLQSKCLLCTIRY